jgi:Carboxypeptidase regulatory-like domain
MCVRSVQRIAFVPARMYLLLCLVVFLVVVPAFGQQVVNATLSGSVTDPTGANVPGAVVTATNQATNIVTRTTSDSAGNYIFPSLPPGTYTLRATKSGFQTQVMSGIILQVNQQATINIKLTVGAVTTSVEVSGAAPLVQTTTASVGTVISGEKIKQLPMNLREFGGLAVLVPGTTIDNGGFANSNIGSPFSQTTYVANGTRSASNNVLIDGVMSRNLTFGGFAIQPPPDAIQEFKIQTNIYDAAFGTSAGSTINVVLKAGTNQFHGGVWEFLRNDALDARNFFATTRPEFRRNQFGGEAGGPIQKDKTFIYGSAELLRRVQGNSSTDTIPTPTQLSGDLSGALTGNIINLCGAGGPSNLNYDSGQLFDPATLSNFTCTSGANAGKTILVGTPIPGNMITNISPVSQKLLSYVPAPNRSGFPNFVQNTPVVENDYQFNVRVDHTIGPKDQMFGHYLFAQSRTNDPTSGYSILPGFGDTTYFRGQNVALSWTHTISPNMLNEAEFGFQRDWNIRSCISCPRSAGTMENLGIQGLQALSPADEGIPAFQFANFATIGDSNYRPVVSPDMVESYIDNVTWTHGKQTIIAGINWQVYQVFGEEAPYSPHGQFGFDGRFSGLAGQLPGAVGVSDLADFLLGYPDTASRTLKFLGTNQVGGWFYSNYVQDNIKFTSNFSMNIGLRWEFRRPSTDKRDNFVTFVPLGPKFSGPGNGVLVTAAPQAQNDALCQTEPWLNSSVTGECLVASGALRGALGFTGRTSRSLVYPNYKNFAPRLGLTWRPTHSDRLIVHTGIGKFYDLGNFNNQHFVDNNPVFSPSQNTTTATGSPVPTLANGQLQTIENVFSGATTPPLDQQFVSLYVAPNYRAPYATEWSFGIESQWSNNWATEITYIGNRSVHQGFLHLFANQPEPGLGDFQPRRPYPEFGQMLFTTPDAYSTYEGLQTKVTKRYSKGYTMLVAYTYSKSLDNNEGDEGFGGGQGNSAPQNDNNPAAEYGRSYADTRHRVSVAGVWDLPFGKGRHFMNTGGVADVVLGGWEGSWIVTAQSGFPFSVVIGTDPANTGSLVNRPDRVCSGVGAQTPTNWFDASCFPVSALDAALNAGTPRFGNAGRNILDAPGLLTFDLGVHKTFKFTERYSLEFRSDIFNAFNHTNFTTVGNSVTNPSTVGVLTGAREPRDIQFALKLMF